MVDTTPPPMQPQVSASNPSAEETEALAAAAAQQTAAEAQVTTAAVASTAVAQQPTIYNQYGYPVLAQGQTPVPGVVYAMSEYSSTVYRVNAYGSTEVFTETTYNPNKPAPIAPGSTGAYVVSAAGSGEPVLSATYEPGAVPYEPNQYSVGGTNILFNPATGNLASGGGNPVLTAVGGYGEGPWTGAQGVSQDMNTKVAQYTEGGTPNPNYNPNATPTPQGAAAIAELIASKGGGQLQPDVAKLAVAEGFTGKVSPLGYVESATVQPINPGALNTAEVLGGPAVYYTKDGMRKVADNAANIAEMLSLNGGGQLEPGVAELARAEGAGALVTRSGYVPSIFTAPPSAPENATVTKTQRVLSETTSPQLTEVEMQNALTAVNAKYSPLPFLFGPLTPFINGVTDFISKEVVLPATNYFYPQTTKSTIETTINAPASYFVKGGASMSTEVFSYRNYNPMVTATVVQDQETKQLSAFQKDINYAFNTTPKDVEGKAVVVTAGVAGFANYLGENISQGTTNLYDANKNIENGYVRYGANAAVGVVGMVAAVVPSILYLPVAAEWALGNRGAVISKAVAIGTDMGTGIVETEMKYPGSAVGSAIGMYIGGKLTKTGMDVLRPTIAGALPFEFGRVEIPAYATADATGHYLKFKVPDLVAPDFEPITKPIVAVKTAIQSIDILQVADKTRTFIMDKAAPALMPDVIGGAQKVSDFVGRGVDKYQSLAEKIPLTNADLRVADYVRDLALNKLPEAVPDIYGGIKATGKAVGNAIDRFAQSDYGLQTFEYARNAAIEGSTRLMPDTLALFARVKEPVVATAESIKGAVKDYMERPSSNYGLRAMDYTRTLLLERLPEAIPDVYGGMKSIYGQTSAAVDRFVQSDYGLRVFERGRQYVIDNAGRAMPDVLGAFEKASTLVDRIPDSYYRLIERIPVGDADLRLFDRVRDRVLNADYGNLIPKVDMYLGKKSLIFGYMRVPALAAETHPGFNIADLTRNPMARTELGNARVNPGQVPTWTTPEEARAYFKSMEGKEGVFWHATRNQAFAEDVIRRGGFTTKDVGSQIGMYYAEEGQIYTRFFRNEAGEGTPVLFRYTGAPRTVAEALKHEGTATNPTGLPEGLFPGLKALENIGWEPAKDGVKGHTVTGKGNLQKEFYVPGGQKLVVTGVSYAEVPGVGTTTIVDVRHAGRAPMKWAVFAGEPTALLETLDIDMPVNPMGELAVNRFTKGQQAILGPYITEMSKRENAHPGVTAAANYEKARATARGTNYQQRELLGEEVMRQGAINEQTTSSLYELAESAGEDVVGGGSEVVRAFLGEASPLQVGDKDWWAKQNRVHELQKAALDIVSEEHPEAPTAMKPGTEEPATFASINRKSGLPIGDVGIPGREKPIVGIHSIEEYPSVTKNVQPIETVGGHTNVVRTLPSIFESKASGAFDRARLRQEPGGRLELIPDLNEKNIKHMVGASAIGKETAALNYGVDIKKTGMRTNYEGGKAAETYARALDELLSETKNQAEVEKYTPKMNRVDTAEGQAAKKAAQMLAGGKNPIGAILGVDIEVPGRAAGVEKAYPFERRYVETGTEILSIGVSVATMTREYPIENRVTTTSESSSYPITTNNIKMSTSTYPTTTSILSQATSTYPVAQTSYPSNKTTYPVSQTEYPTTKTEYPTTKTEYPTSTYPIGSSSYPASSSYPSNKPAYPSTSLPPSSGIKPSDYPFVKQKNVDIWQNIKPKKLKHKPHEQTFEYPFDVLGGTKLQLKALGLNQQAAQPKVELFYRTGKQHAILAVPVAVASKPKPIRYPKQTPLGINIPTTEYYRTTGNKGIANVESNAIPIVIKAPTIPKNSLPKGLLPKKKKQSK